MPPPALPAELTDAIIDHLYNDRTALAACSLTCRAFRDAAQHHLLATILCVGDAVERLLAQLEIQDGSSRIEDDAIDNDNSDARFVVGRGVSRAADEKGLSDAFAQHIREVRFRGQGSTVDEFSVWTIERIFAALPNLHTLHLASLGLRPSDAAHGPDARGAEAQRRYRLRWLDLYEVHVPDLRLLSALLGLCVELEKLTIQCMNPSTGRCKLYAVKEEERICCKSLVVDGHWSLPFEVWRMLRTDALKAYELKNFRLDHVPKALEMLNAAAGSLESLTLKLSSARPVFAWESLKAIPWTTLTNLSLILESESNVDPLYLDPIVSLLSYLPQTISAVTLELCARHWALETVGWGGLETQLLRFNLRSLTLRLFPRETYGEGSRLEAAMRSMPTLSARGILAEHPPAQ